MNMRPATDKDPAAKKDMADKNATQRPGIARRELIIAGAGAAAVAAGLGGGATAVAQTAGTAPAAPPSGSPQPGKVAVEKRGAVLLIALDRPEYQNRIDPPIIIGLGKAFYQLDHDDELRVAVLYGNGRDFCAGGDLQALAAGFRSGTIPPKDPDWVNPFGLQPPYRTKPVVVAVHGQTQFGGHENFLAADIRVAASDTVFSQAEAIRGVLPSAGGAIRFQREAGWGNAMRYLLTGDSWGAEEAHRMGLVQEVTPPGKQLDRALELATKVAAAAPLGVRATLASARQALPQSEATALAALTPEFNRLLQTEDVKEAQLALKEHRQPVFHGR
jgi:enoyl-CoA hydratase